MPETFNVNREVWGISIYRSDLDTIDLDPRTQQGTTQVLYFTIHEHRFYDEKEMFFPACNFNSH